MVGIGIIAWNFIGGLCLGFSFLALGLQEMFD